MKDALCRQGVFLFNKAPSAHNISAKPLADITKTPELKVISWQKTLPNLSTTAPAGRNAGRLILHIERVLMEECVRHAMKYLDILYITGQN